MTEFKFQRRVRLSLKRARAVTVETSSFRVIIRLTGHVQIARRSYALIEHQEDGFEALVVTHYLPKKGALLIRTPDGSWAAVIWPHGEVEAGLTEKAISWLSDHDHLASATLLDLVVH